MRAALFSIAFIFSMPALVYGAYTQKFNNDPESIYVKTPNLFSGKWERAAYSDNFSEYIDPNRLERNFDLTIEVVALRNYYKKQVDDDNKEILFALHLWIFQCF